MPRKEIRKSIVTLEKSLKGEKNLCVVLEKWGQLDYLDKQICKRKKRK